MEFEQPQVKRVQESENYAKFQVEPLETGFGTTLGNALRRVLLSSVPGAAITSVKIDGVLHEFSTIPGVKEDTTELLLNLKDLNIKVEGEIDPEQPAILRIAARGAGEVTGADVQCPENVVIVNPEAYIATISEEDGSLQMEMTVEVSKGYVLPENQEKYKAIIGTIPVGSVFTPVRKVNFTTEPTRVGNKTNYERLVLEIWTNGTMTANESLSKAAEILTQHVGLFVEGDGVTLMRRSTEEAEGAGGMKAPDARIEELDFSVRTYNCLRKAGITTVQDLVQTSEQELMNIRNFGRKSLTEVKEKLAGMSLSLRPPREGEEVVAYSDDDEGEEE